MLIMTSIKLAALAAIITTLSGFSHARASLITMDEVPEQSVNGLSLKGALFSFTVDGTASSDATINAFGVGDLTYVQDPSLEGSAAGLLTIDFDTAVESLSFGLAIDSEDERANAANVALYSTSLASPLARSVNMQPLVVFSEALFEYSGTPVSRIELTFTEPTGRFVLDNLSFTASSVPEPGTTWTYLMGLGLVAATRLAARRH